MERIVPLTSLISVGWYVRTRLAGIAYCIPAATMTDDTPNCCCRSGAFVLRRMLGGSTTAQLNVRGRNIGRTKVGTSRYDF